MTDQLLRESSQHIRALIALATLHEENITRLSQQNQMDTSNLVSILTPLFTYSVNLNTDVSNSVIDPIYVLDTSFNNISDPLNLTCPITREDFDDTDPVCMILACRHIFKRAPFIRWVSRSNRCPCCRTVIGSRINENIE
jgi:hypothetical protein